MKNITNIKSAFIHTAMISGCIFFAIACNSHKPEDTKEVAEDHNEAKFNNTGDEKNAQFLVNAAEVSIEEIQLGQLAQQKSTKPDIQALGEMMVTGHKKSLAEVTALAKKKGISIPVSATDDAKAAYDKLNNKSGSYFDKDYSDKMVKGHKETIEKFEKYIKDSNDPEIKAWAEKTLVDLKMHLDHSLICQKKSQDI